MGFEMKDPPDKNSGQLPFDDTAKPAETPKKPPTPPTVKKAPPMEPNAEIILPDPEPAAVDLLDNVPEDFDDSSPIQRVKQLPSEYKTYTNGEKTEITYKPHGWGQTLRLTGSDMPIKQLWETILAGITTDKSLPKLKLTLSDFFYIAFLMRASTTGRQPFDVEVYCYNKLEETGANCDYKNIFTIKDSRDPAESELEYDNMELTADQLPIVIEFDTYVIELYPMTVSDAFVLMNKNKFQDPLSQVAIQIKNMKYDDAIKLLEDDAKVDKVIGNIIQDEIKKYYHRLKPIERKCAGCNQKLMVQLDAGGTIIKPFRKPSDNVRVRVRYGKVR